MRHKRNNRPQASNGAVSSGLFRLGRNVPKIEKPWGHEIVWARTDRYVGKILHLRRGEALSYQYHRVKEETIRLLDGRMRFEFAAPGAERSERVLEPGDVVHISPGMRHRMEALEDCNVLEVSTPELDDIVRLEDRYGRTGGNHE